MGEKTVLLMAEDARSTHNDCNDVNIMGWLGAKHCVHNCLDIRLIVGGITQQKEQARK